MNIQNIPTILFHIHSSSYKIHEANAYDAVSITSVEQSDDNDIYISIHDFTNEEGIRNISSACVIDNKWFLK